MARRVVSRKGAEAQRKREEFGNGIRINEDCDFRNSVGDRMMGCILEFKAEMLGSPIFWA
jgi:hypothetical protein